MTYTGSLDKEVFQLRLRSGLYHERTQHPHFASADQRVSRFRLSAHNKTREKVLVIDLGVLKGLP